MNDPDTLPNHEVLCGLVAAMVTAISSLWCWGTSVQPGDELVRLLGVSLLLVCVPYVLWQWKPRWSPPVAAFISFIGLVLLGWGLPEGFLPLFRNLLVVAGGMLMCGLLVIWLRQARRRSVVGMVLIAVLYTAALSGQVWRQGFRHPLLVYDIATNGIVTPDALFHPVVAGMLESYGVASSGLDGTPYMAYHFGTHWCLAQLARLLGVTPLEIFHLGYATLAVPLGLWAALKLIVAVQSGLRREAVLWERPQSGAQHLLLVMGFVGPLPTFMIASRVLEWSLFFSTEWGWFFTSESQALGLTVLLLLLAILIGRWSAMSSSNVPVSWSQRAVEWGLAMTAAAVLAWLKVTIAHLVLVGLIYLMLRSRSRRRWGLVMIAYAVTLISVSLLTTRPFEGEAMRLAPFKLWWEKIPLGLWPAAPVLFSLPAILYSGLRFSQRGLRTIGDVVAAIRQREVLDVELVAILAAVGVLATIVLGGYTAFNSLYYQETVSFVCLMASVGALGVWQQTCGAAVIRRWQQWWTLRLSDVCVATGLLVAMGVCLLNMSQWLRNAMWINIQSRGDGVAVPVGRYSEPGKPGMREALHTGDVGRFLELASANTRHLEQRMQNGDRVFLRVLTEIGETLPLQVKQETALWVPRSNREFWELTEENRRFTPFVAGALTGLALIDGLPEVNRRRDYGFNTYSALTQSPAASRSRNEVLLRARQLGYRQVLELQTGGRLLRHQLLSSGRQDQDSWSIAHDD